MNLVETAYDVLITGLRFPEGPCFDQNGNLWFVEIQGNCLCKWDGHRLERIQVNGTPNGAAIDKNGNVWFCDSERGEIRKFDPLSKEIESVCKYTTDGSRLIRPNDLLFDHHSNLLFSDHADGRQKPVSTICVLPKGETKARVISDNKYFTNGLAFMKNGTTLVFSETYRQTLWRAEWNPENLELKNEQHFAAAGDGPWGPDGIAFDEYENLYVSVFNEHAVNVYNKEGGLVKTLSCEGSRPTSCAFDPFGRFGLVVTEAERGEIISYKTGGRGMSLYPG